MKLRLYTLPESSAGQRVQIALNLKRVAYECVASTSIDALSYRRMNPQGLMPVLEIDGHPFAQSLAIMELIDELIPEPALLPRDPLLRAQARSFAQLIASDLHPLNNRRVRRYIAENFAADDVGQQAWYRNWVNQAFVSLEAELAQRSVAWRFCFGDTPGLADACLIPQMQKAREFACDIAQYPLLEAVDAACREREEFLGWNGLSTPTVESKRNAAS